MSRLSKRGFTLIELLVVVAIIAILIAILLPALSRVRQQTRTTKCLTNVRNMGSTVQLYLAEWKSMFPYVDSLSNTTSSWTQLLRGNQGSSSFGAIDKVRLCPDAPSANQSSGAGNPWFGTAHFAWGNSPQTGPDPQTGQALIASYGMNAFIYSYTQMDMSAIGGQPGENFSLPNVNGESRIPVFVDCLWRHMVPHPNDSPSQSGNIEDPGPHNLGGTLPISYAMLNRHNRAVNVSFLDGHGATTPLKDLYTLQWSKTWTQPASIPTIPLQ